MKTSIRILLAALTLLTGVIHVQAQGNAFTYQGRITDNGAPYTGNAEFQATLWDAVSGGSQIAANSPTQIAVGVTNGLFVLPLDFGANFPGANRWLQLEVRTTIGPFTAITPRQQLTPAPYAITAGNLTGTLPAAQLSGTVASANLSGTYSGAVTLNNAANSFSGSGAGLTGLDASQLASGTVPDTRLAGNVARTDQVWQLGGNAGTTSATHFLGTTDDQPLELKVHGMRALRLQSSFLPLLDSFGPTIAINLIAGSHSNSIGAGTFGAVIGGGGATNVTPWVPLGSGNTISHDPEPGDGLFNRVGSSAHFSSIVGGAANFILSNSWISAIGGGGGNRIGPDGNGSVIAGGAGNHIVSSTVSSIGGGLFNKIGTTYAATIGGGHRNTITGAGAAIPGGFDNSATNYAFAAGTRAEANHTGAFVWSDARGTAFASTGPNQFCIRASGGVQLMETPPCSLAPPSARRSTSTARPLASGFKAASNTRGSGWAAGSAGTRADSITTILTMPAVARRS